jgi:hypothetical protein
LHYAYARGEGWLNVSYLERIKGTLQGLKIEKRNNEIGAKE